MDRGEIYGLLGPNGAGKTTCFDILAGFLDPDAGEVCLAGRPLDGEARVAGIECEQPAVLRARAEALGLAWRPAGQRTAVWLPERETLEAVASRFQGLPIRGLDLHPVRLEDVYQEVVGRA